MKTHELLPLIDISFEMVSYTGGKVRHGTLWASYEYPYQSTAHQVNRTY